MDKTTTKWQPVAAMPKCQNHSQLITQAAEGFLVDTQKESKPQQDPQMASFGIVYIMARDRKKSLPKPTF